MKIDEKKFNLWFNAFILIGMLVAVAVFVPRGSAE